MAASSSSLAISSRLPAVTRFSNQQSRVPFSVVSLPSTTPRTTPALALAKSSSSSAQFMQNEFGVGLVTKGKDGGRGSFCQTAAVRHLTGSLLSAEGFRFAIVVARFNEIVTRPLLDGALDTFKRYSVKDEDIDVVWVPGSFEIGLVAKKLAQSQKYQAILCIGAVVRGDTTHYEAVANTAASGVMSAALSSGVPCIFGVLTTENMDQALNRAGGKVGNKGSEAALTAIEMASLFKHHLE